MPSKPTRSCAGVKLHFGASAGTVVTWIPSGAEARFAAESPFVRVYSCPQNDIRQRDCNVRFGSLADTCSAKSHVRFTPESGHSEHQTQCPLSANSGHRHTARRRRMAARCQADRYSGCEVEFGAKQSTASEGFASLRSRFSFLRHLQDLRPCASFVDAANGRREWQMWCACPVSSGSVQSRMPPARCRGSSVLGRERRGSTWRR